MPRFGRCVLGLVCNLPNGELRDGHRCRKCRERVHAFCSHEDSSHSASSNLLCFLCAGNVTIDQVLNAFEETTTNQYDTPGNNDETTKTTATILPHDDETTPYVGTPSPNNQSKKAAPSTHPNKSKSTANTRVASLPSNRQLSSKLKKSNQQKGFTVVLRRFQQIRSVLHFNDNSKIEGSQDAAFKVSHAGFL